MKLYELVHFSEQFKPSNVMFRNCADISIVGPGSRSSTKFSHQSDKSSSRQSRPKASSNKNSFEASSHFGSSSFSDGHQQESNRQGQRVIAFPDDSQYHQRPNYNQQSDDERQQPSASVFGQASRQYSSNENFRYADQSPQKFEQAFHHDFLFGQNSAPLVRNERQPAQGYQSAELAKPTGRLEKQHDVIFPGSNDPKYSEATGAKLSGANKAKFLRQNSNTSGNKGFSGSDSGYQSRSKSVYPFHQPQVYTGEASPYFF